MLVAILLYEKDIFIIDIYWH